MKQTKHTPLSLRERELHDAEASDLLEHSIGYHSSARQNQRQMDSQRDYLRGSNVAEASRT